MQRGLYIATRVAERARTWPNGYLAWLSQGGSGLDSRERNVFLFRLKGITVLCRRHHHPNPRPFHGADWQCARKFAIRSKLRQPRAGLQPAARHGLAALETRSKAVQVACQTDHGDAFLTGALMTLYSSAEACSVISITVCTSILKDSFKKGNTLQKILSHDLQI